jgi:hypothetical protein
VLGPDLCGEDQRAVKDTTLMEPADLTTLPTTDPTALLRYRDGI